MSILGPAPPPKYCDPRLSRLRIGFWTRVAISNDLAAALISFYLENDHPIMGMFDADLFLDDLVEHRLTYCSAMLVTAVLYLSCQAYTRSDVRSSSFVPEFLDEARTLWLAEQNPDLAGTLAAAERITDPITTIAAAELMALGCQVNGQNDLGYDFLNAGRQMAERIGLINTPPTSPKLRYIASKSPEWISAASHVAWGTYNWLSVHGLYFRDPPIAHPPNLPVPAERSSTIDRQLDSSESHEDFRPAPAYMGSTFSTMCRFWTIVQEVAVVYFKHDKRSLSQRVPLAFAEAKYQRLLAWTDTLAMGMARGEYSPAHVLIFHMNFHSVVMQLFHPFVREQSSFSKHRLRSFSSEDSCLANVFNASLNQLGRLMFIYQRSCVSATWSIFVNPPLVQLADAMLAARFSRTTHGRLFFLLCISAWLDLYESYYFFWDIVKGFLARAMRDGTMTSNEAKSLMAELRRRGAHHGTPKLASSSIIIDFDRAAANPDEARTRAIAEQFDELALQEELTTGDYEEK
ncbi:nitrate assimilation regulatory protein nirA [Purpureocillium lilacinum]|uniref:Nitrate assimilation regulatory protein nirA n=2 Tax=Purpureocillium lilacinum TaxID=33203 RepID=A0A179I042_PURLI|nr:nitrate assimilation regulatory protein nirA [Purpureocillium lilacinum]OAQ87559.1 nitrate assimilation regulatory protein nirA [Purpureocillium lilacinum]OAQ95522.1 nitrate assimilation regulatory protein nirA [Purpureocillium lilacinum]